MSYHKKCKAPRSPPIATVSLVLSFLQWPFSVHVRVTQVQNKLYELYQIYYFPHVFTMRILRLHVKGLSLPLVDQYFPNGKRFWVYVGVL
jgi:hypothetical protein